MSDREQFDRDRGFMDGYLACLYAFTPHCEGTSTAFVEAVRAYGDPNVLLLRARTTRDIVLPELKKAVAEIRDKQKAQNKHSEQGGSNE
jgi:uroporphyrinogen-III synthase